MPFARPRHCDVAKNPYGLAMRSLMHRLSHSTGCNDVRVELAIHEVVLLGPLQSATLPPTAYCSRQWGLGVEEGGGKER